MVANIADFWVQRRGRSHESLAAVLILALCALYLIEFTLQRFHLPVDGSGQVAGLNLAGGQLLLGGSQLAAEGEQLDFDGL